MIRDEVLCELEQNRGKRISGGMLAQKLGVTRAAVWKAIASLKAEGMNIQSVKGGGYCLEAHDDSISAQGIYALTNTKYIGKEIAFFEEVNSTNTVLRQEFSGKEEGFAVISERQSAGKGRMGRIFSSPDGGIYVSVLLKPDMPVENLGFLTILAAVAASMAIEECTGLKAGIKWVNDVLYKGKKLCGILTEASIEGETGKIEHVVVGTGINVRTDVNSMPEPARSVAGALKDFCDAPPRRAEIAACLLQTTEKCYDILKSENGQSKILKMYSDRLCCLNQKVEVYSANESYEAICEGINDVGNLIVRTDDGQKKVLQAGEIRIKTH